MSGDVDERLFLYWSAATNVLQRPAEAHPYFVRAFEGFTERGDTEGAWLAWAGVVDSIFLLYRDLHELDAWLAWVTDEREALLDRMPAPVRGLIVASVLFALSFRQPDHRRMAAWRERAERYIEVDPASDIGARLCAALIPDYIWRGNMNGAQTALKRFHARAALRPLSPLTTVLGHLNDATYYLHSGELDRCIESVEAGLAASARHDLPVWDAVFHCHAIASACSRDNVRLAQTHLDAVEALMARDAPIDEGYYRGMLAWTSFVAGDHIGLVSKCESCVAYGESKGVPYLRGVSRIVAALPLHACGERARAWQLLNESSSIGAALGNRLLVWITELFRAHFLYDSGEHASGDHALAVAMKLGRDHAFTHFFCWPRRIIANLIDRALARNFSSDYASRLAAIHGLDPGPQPARSDAWPFAVRIYTLGEPRVVFADGRVQALSVQFSRQLELLAALIAAEGVGVPLHRAASDIYQRESHVDAVGSTKHVLHSLRTRLGPVVQQRDGLLRVDFSKVWIDACSFFYLRRDPATAEIAHWLDEYYQGHFLESVEDSEIVLSTRRRLSNQVEQVLRAIRKSHLEPGQEDACRIFEARWQRLFPVLFATSPESRPGRY